MASLSLAPGALLDERYELLNLLGEGAAGQVWLSRDRHRSIEVALKLLRRRLVSSQDLRSRFDREAELSARMLSPHIVKVLGGGLSDGRPYIVYERLEGQDLRSYLTAHGALTLAEAKTLVVHVCRALSRAHAVGVLHRDIKPDNIFRTTDPDGRLIFKLVDFGVAELTRTAATEIVGTLQYLAPEVLMGEAPADTRADLYALGAVAYECATGKPAFEADTMGQLLLLHATETWAPPRLGDAVDEWFACVLARDPKDRFATAKEMATALHAATDVGERPSVMPSAMPPAEAPAELPSRVPPPVPRTPPPSSPLRAAEPQSDDVERISTRYALIEQREARVRPPPSKP